MLMQCFIHVKVSFEKKNPILPFEKFLARNTIMLQHLIIYSSRHYLLTGRLREKKQRKISKFLAIKVIMVAYERWSLTRGSKYSDLTCKPLVFWETGR